MRGFSFVLLMGIIGCSRGPTLLVPVENIPPQAMSLAPLATHSQDGSVAASIEALLPYDLPQPTPSKTSFLLRLPDNFAGEISVDVAAMQGPGGTGCVLRLGSAQDMFMPDPLDDTVVVSLKDPDATDSGCLGTPRVFVANPNIGHTAGGDMVVISGWGFVPGAEVFFGDTKATAVQYLTAGSLQVTTPKTTGFGLTPVKVVNPDGSQATLKDGYRYFFDPLSFSSYPPQTSSDTIVDFGVYQLDSADNMDADFLYTNTDDEVTSILFPALSYTSYALHTPLSNLAVLDVDNDGDLDVALGLPMMNQVQLGVNDGHAKFSSAPTIPAGNNPVAIAAGDLDGDGYSDVVVVNQTTPAGFSVLLNNKTGGFGAATFYQYPTAAAQIPQFITIVDMNYDQRPDIVIADKTAAQFVIFVNQGQGVFASNRSGSGYIMLSFAGTASQMLTYDINNDGILDLVIPQETQNTVLMSISDPAGMLLPLHSVAATSPRKVAFGDINGDGRVDMLSLNASDYAVDIYLQQSGGSTKNPYYLDTPTLSIPLSASMSTVGALLGIGIIDFPPADGKLDIVAAGINGFAVLSNNSQ